MFIWKRKNDEEQMRERSRSQPITSSVSQNERNDVEQFGKSPQNTRQQTSFSICCEKFSRISPNALNDPERGGVTWIRDASVQTCGTCNNPFTVINRRHHCRKCGYIFCHSCSSKSIDIPSLGFIKPVRVCNRCYELEIDQRKTEDMLRLLEQQEQMYDSEFTNHDLPSSEKPTIKGSNKM